MENIMPLGSSAVTLALFIVAVIVIIKTIRIVPQQHALVIERFGRFHAVLAPGLNFVLPFVDRVAYQHDLREIPFDVPSQICITKDNTQLQVDGILYFQVTDPRLASYGSSNFRVAITQLAQTTLRSVIGKMELDRTFEERDQINLAAGARAAAIAQSEGVKQAEINTAQGQAAAILSIAEANAQAIRQVAEAINSPGGISAVNLKVAEQYVAVFANLAKTGNTLIVPSNLSDLATLVTSVTTMFKAQER